MARTSFLLACLTCCLCVMTAYANTYEVMQDTTYKQLKPVSGQWSIDVSATKGADKTVFEPVVCESPALTAPCNNPPLTADKGDKVRVQLSLKNTTLKTIDNLEPKRVVVRACYTKAAAVDRPWRRANEVIDKDKSCPFIIKSAELNATKFNFNWTIPKNMTKATWYTNVLVICKNGTGTSYCQTDNTVNKTYFGTTIINSTPKGMVVATAICSALGPLFLAGYFVKDMFTRGKASS